MSFRADGIKWQLSFTTEWKFIKIHEHSKKSNPETYFVQKSILAPENLKR